mmetsp:Transcript_3792/g.8311  ORF Transcript_3792/g.8311 Transcript_3792/m.8311 type:complete len:271 (-) Transcript_3792:248-1060(-)
MMLSSTESVTSASSGTSKSTASTRLGGDMLCSKNGNRVILILLLILIPLISYRDEIFLAFPNPSSPQVRSNELASEAFNSYKLNSPLFEAVRSNDLELVRSLLDGGIKSNKKSKENIKKMYYNVNAEDSVGITPLIEATLLGNVELVQLLLHHGARAQPSEGFRHTPLRAACLTANTTLIKLLLKEGADPNARSEGGRTPLMGACYLRPKFDEREDRIQLSFDAVKMMLEDERTDARIKNDYGETALDLCRERAYNKSMAMLRQRIAGLV